MPQVRTKPEKKQAKNQQDQITLDSNFAKTDQLASIVESNTMENHHDYYLLIMHKLTIFSYFFPSKISNQWTFVQ